MIELAQLQVSAEQIAALLKTMSHPKRLLILCMFSGSPDTSVGELARITGLSASAMSQHLAHMRDEGLIDSQRDVQRVLYSIKNEVVNAIIVTLKNVYCPQGVTMALTTISPHDAQELIAHGAKLIDTRDADEYLREYIPEADLAPLSVLERSGLPTKLRHEQTISHCQADRHTSNNADRLAAIAAPTEILLLEDGIDGWKKVGLPVAVNKSQPLPLMRQVQIAAGGLILIGIALGYTINSGFSLLSDFVGAGLLFVGISGFCGTARLLDKMPWNQRAWEATPDAP